jgi:hypothetical protein
VYASRGCHLPVQTTVVAPLLALMLADGKRLVAQVVPQALLDFSRSVTRERFSAVVRKAIYTFVFDRFCRIDELLLRKLLKAVESRAVLVCTATSLKAFQLKFVELLHNSDHMHTSASIQAEQLRQKGRKKELKQLQEDYVTRTNALKEQLELGVRIMRILRTASLLLDEVDLILHPLKVRLLSLGEGQAFDVIGNAICCIGQLTHGVLCFLSLTCVILCSLSSTIRSVSQLRKT